MTKETCSTCKFIGVQYWGDDYAPVHHCLKSDDRRAERFVSCGDRAQDFMNEFRKFYDAGPRYEACKFYDRRPSAEQATLDILRELKDAGGRKCFKFFSDENHIATKLNGKFVREDTKTAEMNGYRAYRLTQLGEAELMLRHS